MKSRSLQSDPSASITRDLTCVISIVEFWLSLRNRWAPSVSIGWEFPKKAHLCVQLASPVVSDW